MSGVGLRLGELSTESARGHCSRLMKGHLVDGSKLAPVGLFANLAGNDIERLAASMREENHPVGTVLVEEGDLPTKFFVLLSGHVTVHRGGHHVADLGPGDYFGEVGVISLEPRNATVLATTSVQVAVTMGWEMRDLLENAPDLKRQLEEAARLRAPTD